jgi:hypothetical protein
VPKSGISLASMRVTRNPSSDPWHSMWKYTMIIYCILFYIIIQSIFSINLKRKNLVVLKRSTLIGPISKSRGFLKSIPVLFRIRSDPNLFGLIRTFLGGSRSGSGRFGPDPDLRLLNWRIFNFLVQKVLWALRKTSTVIQLLLHEKV